jgi:hypothetical protein
VGSPADSAIGSGRVAALFQGWSLPGEVPVEVMMAQEPSGRLPGSAIADVSDPSCERETGSRERGCSGPALARGEGLASTSAFAHGQDDMCFFGLCFPANVRRRGIRAS